MYLLDTNAWVAFLRHANSPVVPRLKSKAVSDVCTCAVVVAELQYGCLRSAKPTANLAKVRSLLQPYRSLTFDDSAAGHFSRIRRFLELQGAMIGPYDLQIAAIALSSGLTLVTHNTAEFCRVPALLLEDWEV
jgi:tRNA(fMet)-specific endonuclease VapC